MNDKLKLKIVLHDEITIGDLVKWYKDDNEAWVRGYDWKLDIRPPYQREFIYNDIQRYTFPYNPDNRQTLHRRERISRYSFCPRMNWGGHYKMQFIGLQTNPANRHSQSVYW